MVTAAAHYPHNVLKGVCYYVTQCDAAEDEVQLLSNISSYYILLNQNVVELSLHTLTSRQACLFIVVLPAGFVSN